jgi:penicillin-binding protein 1A
MRELNFITPEQYEQAKAEPLNLARPGSGTDVSLPGQYVAEMVRQAMYARYQDKAYTDGYKVYTTINSHDQQWAYDALRAGLQDYDRHTGYHGPESYVDLSDIDDSNRDESLEDALSEIRDSGDLQPAIVLEASQRQVKAFMRGGKIAEVQGAGLDFARRALSSKAPENQQIRPGAVVRLHANAKGQWEITQLPEVAGAFVSLDPHSGAIRSLVGGFDFSASSFNHVTQAWRQPGSGFKPYIYSAALEKGFTASSMINDAPLTFQPTAAGSEAWTPKDDDGKYMGMMTIRHALALSRNMVSIRLLMAMGTDYASQYIQRFGFSPKQHPPYLTMALGAGSLTPLQQAEGFAVFANGGYRVNAYFIDRIEDQEGHVLARTAPVVAGQNAQRVIDPRNAFIMTSIMKDVVRYGTATRAMSLGRSDLAGKTGTTNDYHDAWFSGFNPDLVAVVWVGFDQPKSLGRWGYGATAALPIWINYMANALKGKPDVDLPVPEGIVVKPGMGMHGADEYYYQEYQSTNPELQVNNSAPRGSTDSGDASGGAGNAAPGGDQPAPAKDAVDNVKEQLF